MEAVVVRREELEAVGPLRFEFALYFTKLEEGARQQLEGFLSRQA